MGKDMDLLVCLCRKERETRVERRLECFYFKY